MNDVIMTRSTNDTSSGHQSDYRTSWLSEIGETDVKIQPHYISTRDYYSKKDNSRLFHRNIRDLEYGAVKRIGETLSHRRLVANDYHILADRLGYTWSQIESLEKKDNPGFELLKDWSTRTHSTVGVLEQKLLEIDRQDCLAVLHEYTKGCFLLPIELRNGSPEHIFLITTTSNNKLCDLVREMLGALKSKYELRHLKIVEPVDVHWKTKARHLRGKVLVIHAVDLPQINDLDRTTDPISTGHDNPCFQRSLSNPDNCRYELLPNNEMMTDVWNVRDGTLVGVTAGSIQKESESGRSASTEDCSMPLKHPTDQTDVFASLSSQTEVKQRASSPLYQITAAESPPYASRLSQLPLDSITAVKQLSEVGQSGCIQTSQMFTSLSSSGSPMTEDGSFSQSRPSQLPLDSITAVKQLSEVGQSGSMQTSPMFTSLSSSGSSMTEDGSPTQSEESPYMVTNLNGWHHNLAENQVIPFLRHYQKDEGWYVIWTTETSRFIRAVSVTHMNKILNYQIHERRVHGGRTEYYFFKQGYKTPDLADLIAHYSKNEMVDQGKVIGGNRHVLLNKPVLCGIFCACVTGRRGSIGAHTQGSTTSGNGAAISP